MLPFEHFFLENVIEKYWYQFSTILYIHWRTFFKRYRIFHVSLAKPMKAYSNHSIPGLVPTKTGTIHNNLCRIR